jgi:hypothetical protein
MATIGTFKKTGDDYQREIVTLAVQAKNVRIILDTNRSNDQAPSHRVFVGRVDYAESGIMRSGVAGAGQFSGFRRGSAVRQGRHKGHQLGRPDS